MRRGAVWCRAKRMRKRCVSMQTTARSWENAVLEFNWCGGMQEGMSSKLPADSERLPSAGRRRWRWLNPRSLWFWLVTMPVVFWALLLGMMWWPRLFDWRISESFYFERSRTPPGWDTAIFRAGRFQVSKLMLPHDAASMSSRGFRTRNNDRGIGCEEQAKKRGRTGRGDG
jgi:hypothetical protein